MEQNRIRTDAAPKAIGPYEQGAVAGGWLYTAGQVGLDPATGQLVDGLEPQARRALANLAAILDAAGATWADVVKTTVYLADMADFEAVNAVYAEILAEPFPARSTVAVAGLPRGARVEIDAVARVGGSGG